MTVIDMQIHSEDAMQRLASKLSELVPPGSVIYLLGDLGAGKTTFARGFLRGSGVSGRVKSPTFTLVEPYELADKSIFHFDLYRIETADELKQLGLDDYFNADTICLIEWPDKGKPILPAADILCKIEFQCETTRKLSIEAGTDKGKRILQHMETIIR